MYVLQTQPKKCLKEEGVKKKTQGTGIFFLRRILHSPSAIVLLLKCLSTPLYGLHRLNWLLRDKLNWIQRQMLYLGHGKLFFKII